MTLVDGERNPRLDALHHRAKQLEQRMLPVGRHSLDRTSTNIAELISRSLQDSLTSNMQIAVEKSSIEQKVAVKPESETHDCGRLRKQLERYRSLQELIDCVPHVDRHAVKDERLAEWRVQVQRMERRLHRLNLHYAETRLDNSRLQREFEHDNRLADADGHYCRTLRQRLQLVEPKVISCIRESDGIADSRDSAMNELRALAIQIEKHQVQFQREWGILDQLINDQDEGRLVPPMEESHSDLNDDDELKVRGMDQIRSRAFWAMAADSACRTMAENRLDAARNCVNTILKGTGIANVDELVERLDRAELDCIDLYREAAQIKRLLDDAHQERGERQLPMAVIVRKSKATVPEIAFAEVQAMIDELEIEKKNLESEMELILQKLQLVTNLFGHDFTTATIPVNVSNLAEVLDGIERSTLALIKQAAVVDNNHSAETNQVVADDVIVDPMELQADWPYRQGSIVPPNIETDSVVSESEIFLTQRDCKRK